MPYIDTLNNINNIKPDGTRYKVTEGEFANNLAEIISNYGWSLVTTFDKVVADAAFFPNAPQPKGESHTITIGVSKHFIFRNGAAKEEDAMYFGIATFAYWTQRYANIPLEYRISTSIPSFGQWASEQQHYHKETSTLYVYMVEGLKDITSKLDAYNNIVFPWNKLSKNDMKQAALDIEVTKTQWIKPNDGGNSYLTITEAEPYRMQSPIVPITLKAPFVEYFGPPSLGDSYNVMWTNWWYDTEISIRGYIDEETIFLIMQADNVPAFQWNLVPSVPLYIGRIEPFDPLDKPYALFAGSAPLGNSETEVSQFNFDDSRIMYPYIFPILKNYPRYPGNGIEQVLLNRSKLGSRYQAYYLAWNAPPNSMPPKRENGRRQYPRSYDNFQTPIYKYQFNPSMYSDRVHTSKIYVVHPEEGVRGALKKAIAIPAINFNAQKLRVKRDDCTTPTYDVYRYALVDGVSPFTKRPGTHFRPMGVGIYSHVEDKDGNIVTQ